jgi:hypothetical protein
MGLKTSRLHIFFPFSYLKNVCTDQNKKIRKRDNPNITKPNHKERSWASEGEQAHLKVISATITTDIYNEKRNLPPVVRTFTWP